MFSPFAACPEPAVDGLMVGDDRTPSVNACGIFCCCDTRQKG